MNEDLCPECGAAVRVVLGAFDHRPVMLEADAMGDLYVMVTGSAAGKALRLAGPLLDGARMWAADARLPLWREHRHE